MTHPPSARPTEPLQSTPPDRGAETPASGAVWTDADLAASPHARADKADRVRRMFAAIAGSYDLNNRVHSLGLDQAWRRRAVRAAGVRPGETVLDVACGTGDLTETFARRTGAARVIGLDFTQEMLDVAAEKRRRLLPDRAARIEYVRGDAMDLEQIETASVDVVSIAFGIRNVQEPARAVGEFARVLKPGGRLVVLEFDTPRNPLVRWANNLYSGRIMPWTATLLARDRSGAYRYLPRSVGSFMSRDELARVMEEAGFRGVTARPLTLGIVVLYRGVRGA